MPEDAKVKLFDALRRNAELAAFVALYCALYGGWHALGGTFRVWQDLWQLLPWPPLLGDLGGSLLDLHSQPPLLNLLFGASLKLSAGLGVPLESLLQPLYFLVGAATTAATAAFARRLVPKPTPRRLAVGLVLANPYFFAVHHYLFYTAWELLFLGLLAVGSCRFFERPEPSRLAAALAPALLLMYTRSLFHPVWFLGVLALLLVLARHDGAKRWKVVSTGALFCLLLVAWPLKNLARFGFFGFSSWSGISVARGLPTGEPLAPSGYPFRLQAFARTVDEPPDPRAAAEAQRLVPDCFLERPALSSLAKPDGSPNWNHYALIPLSRDVGASGLSFLRRNPSLLLAKAADFYLNGYAVYEGRWPYASGYSPELTVGHGWARVYETVVFQAFRPYDPSRTGFTTGFAVLFPLAVAAVCLALWRTQPKTPAVRSAAVALWTISWVLALVLFVDGPEGNRVRYCTEPYLFLLVGWLASELLVRSRRGGGEGGSRGKAFLE